MGFNFSTTKTIAECGYCVTEDNVRLSKAFMKKMKPDNTSIPTKPSKTFSVESTEKVRKYSKYPKYSK